MRYLHDYYQLVQIKKGDTITFISKTRILSEFRNIELMYFKRVINSVETRMIITIQTRVLAESYLNLISTFFTISLVVVFYITFTKNTNSLILNPLLTIVNHVYAIVLNPIDRDWNYFFKHKVFKAENIDCMDVEL